MSSKNPTEYVEPKFMSEREVRLTGAVASRYAMLRKIMGTQIREGTMLLHTSRSTFRLTFTPEDITAMLDLLMERDEIFLSGMNIALDSPTA
jgi:hypothetical protein